MTISNIHNTARSLRGSYEELYGNQILSDDVIETIVSEFTTSLPWLKDHDPLEAFNEARILAKTLKWSSEYNRNQK